MKCNSCGTEIKIEIEYKELQETDYIEFIKKVSGKNPIHEVETIKCDNCGAETSNSDKIISDDCEFCGNTIINRNISVHQLIKPEGIVPFEISKTEAIAKLNKKLKKRNILYINTPEMLRKISNISGIYLPFWSIDIEGFVKYKTKQITTFEKKETKLINGQYRTRKYKKTYWPKVKREIRYYASNIQVYAGSTLPDILITKLKPWKYYKSFDETYLKGFKTLSYNFLPDTHFDKTKPEMYKAITKQITNDVGGEGAIISSSKSTIDKIDFKLLLLPVWISSYKYKNKIYHFAVNGETGEMQAEKPKNKIIFALIIVLGGLLAIFYYWYNFIYNSNI